MRRMQWYGPSVVLVVATLAILFGGPHVVRQFAFAQQQAEVQQARKQLKDTPLTALSDSFQQIAKAVEPSVVHLAVSKKADQSGRPNNPEDMLRRWFRERYGDQLPEGMPKPDEDGGGGEEYRRFDAPRQYGNGSGWVYEHKPSGKKYVITNNHVVQNADQITVKFYDKTTREATVVGTDPQTDVAVLKVDDGSLHAADLADEPTQQGQLVFAFGSPFQFEFSMSQGIVSGKGRQLGILGQMGYENFIQTDAAINPGNSGGPLTNIKGEVVGMNTAIASRTGAYNGLGFAIPAGMMKSVINQLVESGSVQRGYLGVWIKDLTPELAKSFGYEGKGVLIEDTVNADAPAAEAGLQGGDIITAVGGQPVTNASDLRRRIAGIPPGEDVKITVFRNGETKTFTVTLGKQPEKVASARGGDGGGEDEPGDLEPLRKLGIVAASTFTEQDAQKLGIEHTPGMLVEKVRPGSVAFAEGLRPGAVITSVQGQKVAKLSDVTKALGDADLKQGVRFRVLIDGVNRFIFLKLPN